MKSCSHLTETNNIKYIIHQGLPQLETLTLGTNNLGSLDLCPLASSLAHLTTLNLSNTNLTRCYCHYRIGPKLINFFDLGKLFPKLFCCNY